MSDAAVVIVNHETPDLVLGCLDAIGDDHEVVVVDNGSRDGSVERIRSRGVRVIANERNRGFAAGVNAGVAATSTPYVVLLNADTRPFPEALELLVEHLRISPAAGVAAPVLLEPDGSPQAGAYRRYLTPSLLLLELSLPLGLLARAIPSLDPYRLPSRRIGHGAEVAHASGAALAIRRAAFEAAGPFDEGFFLYLEETEWQERVRKAGWSIALVPHAKVVHLVRGGGSEALAPSPHFVNGARRYLALRGHGSRAIEAAVTAGIASSRAFARLVAVASPRHRTRARAIASAYDHLWRASRASGDLATPRTETGLRRQYAKRCDLPDFSDPELAELIGQIAPSHSAERPHRKSWEFAMAALFLRDVGRLDGRSEVLDVGAGREELLFWLAAKVGRIAAVDLYGSGPFAGREADSQMLDDPAALAPYPYPQERLVVRTADARRLPFADASFDAVVSLSSIEHFGTAADVAQAAREMGRVLRPGGHAFIVTEAFVKRSAIEWAPLQAAVRLLTGGRLAARATLRERAVDVLTVGEIRDRIVVPSGLVLMQPLDLALAPATHENTIRLRRDGSVDPRGASPYPHVLLRVNRSTFTSLALPLVKPG